MEARNAPINRWLIVAGAILIQLTTGARRDLRVVRVYGQAD
jgi:hypothetical protein